MNDSLRLLLVLPIFFTACTTLALGPISQPEEDERPRGLRETLAQGAVTATRQAATPDGFLQHDAIRIPLPPDAQRVERALRQMGLGSEVDRAVRAINRGAEQAAAEARPIFLQAIREITFLDALAILRGEEDAATAYLRRTTEDTLTERFRPIIHDALAQTGATRIYGDIARAYNAVPLTGRTIDPDLTGYVTSKAMDGLFHLIAQEEARIRTDPLARTTRAMRQIFQ